MTLPTLVQNHRKHVVETRLAKFYSVINQALRQSEVENGPLSSWDKFTYEMASDLNGNLTTSARTTNALEWYNKYLKSYLKVLKVEESKTWETGLNVYLSDGGVLTFSYNSWIYYPDAKDLKTLVDENESRLDRNKGDCGKKWFTFGYMPNYGNGGVYPYGQQKNLTDEEIKADSTLGCREEVSTERAYCTLMIARNGWKIPKDYPLKF